MSTGEAASRTTGEVSIADLLTVGGMAFLAGATDVHGLGLLHDLYVSFMSGNTTKLGVVLGGGDWARAATIAAICGLFVAGAAAGAALAVLAKDRHAALVALAVAAVLAVPLLRPGWTMEALVLAMGALNASMSHVGQATVSLTYVTGTLVKFGQGLGRTLCGQPGGWRWLLQLPLWLSFLAGAATAALVRERLGADLAWVLPGLALLLALGVLMHGRPAGSASGPGKMVGRYVARS